MKTILLLAITFILSLQTVNAQWQQVFNISSQLGTSGANILAGTSSSGIYLSTNNGTNWQQTSLTSQNIYTISGKDNYAYTGTSTGIFTSTNNGLNWTSTISGYSVYSFAVIPGYILAGTTAGILISTNNGMNWPQSTLGQTVYALAVNGSTIFAGTQPNGVFISTNQGTNWTQTSLNNRTILSFAVNGNYVYAGTDAYGVYVTSNNGANWAQTSFNSAVVTAMNSTANTIIASTYHSGIYISTNNGANWVQKNEGMANIQLKSLMVSNEYVFAGTINMSGACVYRRPLNEIVGIHQISTEVPDNFSLSQNYPNPFNPLTNIEFSVPKSSFVKLTVFDISGREVETLVSQHMSAGKYKSDWEASKYSSGVYLYKLITDNFISVKKMILVK